MYQFELKPSSRRSAWNSQLDKEVEKFFDVFSKNDTFAPACEILDEEKYFSISLDIPGLKQDEIDVEVRDNRLHVTGERKASKGAEGDKVLRSERRYGKFYRVFGLPQNVDANAIEAKFENGVLDLILPKEEKSQTKKIAINNWSKAEQEQLKS